MTSIPHSSYLNSCTKQFEYYKGLGERTFAQVDEEGLNWQYNSESNSIAQIVKHMHGNMMSRFTNFFTEDGEKLWRQREDEFSPDRLTQAQVNELWQEGWGCTLNTIKSINSDQLEEIIYIRNMGHTVIEALNRQLGHYAYHVGQIVFIGKQLQNEKWESLSIPKGQSDSYNKEKFAKPKSKRHYTDDL